jgi:hypothetical protein
MRARNRSMKKPAAIMPRLLSINRIIAMKTQAKRMIPPARLPQRFASEVISVIGQ